MMPKQFKIQNSKLKNNNFEFLILNFEFPAGGHVPGNQFKISYNSSFCILNARILNSKKGSGKNGVIAEPETFWVVVKME